MSNLTNITATSGNSYTVDSLGFTTSAVNTNPIYIDWVSPFRAMKEMEQLELFNLYEL